LLSLGADRAVLSLTVLLELVDRKAQTRNDLLEFCHPVSQGHAAIATRCWALSGGYSRGPRELAGRAAQSAAADQALSNPPNALTRYTGSCYPPGAIGVRQEEVVEWVHASAVALGIGSQLMSSEAGAIAGAGELQRHVVDVIAWIALAPASLGEGPAAARVFSSRVDV
jgi:hypothetical protein